MKMETLQEQTERLTQHPVVSRDEWLTARRALLKQEKELTDRMDAIAEARRALPWVRVTKPYRFAGPENAALTLSDLFAGNSQLFVYHFMFAPDWSEGCDGCSFIADHFDGPNLHLKHHDVSVVAVSRAPLAKLSAYKKRMGWHFPWYSSADSDFNYDYNASFTADQVAAGKAVYNFEPLSEAEFGGMTELPGMSVFYKDGTGAIFHTYSTYARGGDILLGANNILDMTPKGRNERTIMSWVRRHDQYEAEAAERKCCSSAAAAPKAETATPEPVAAGESNDSCCRS
ncbi:DUF899 domain-containing protein [Verrucomicrobia bacterium LW23]|nr:DUF899 domain-containing protein [Verrucomicrobia bacterium LW23]